MKLTAIPAVPMDGRRINLRPSDYLEARQWAPEVSPGEALSYSIQCSTRAYTGLCGDKVVAIWGHNVTNHEVHVWLMCSDLITEHGRSLLRTCRETIRQLTEQYPDKLICNHVAKNNLQAKRLLAALGFRWVHSPGLSEFDFFYYPR